MYLFSVYQVLYLGMLTSHSALPDTAAAGEGEFILVFPSHIIIFF